MTVAFGQTALLGEDSRGESILTIDQIQHDCRLGGFLLGDSAETIGDVTRYSENWGIREYARRGDEEVQIKFDSLGTFARFQVTSKDSVTSTDAGADALLGSAVAMRLSLQLNGGGGVDIGFEYVFESESIR